MLRLKNLTGGIRVPTGTSPQPRHASRGGPAEPRRLSPPPRASRRTGDDEKTETSVLVLISALHAPNAAKPEHPCLEFTS